MNKFLHISTAIYLVAIILVKMMAMPLSLMEYSLNQKFIAANLCENKANTEMHCAGKCFLKKKLARANDSQDAQNTKGGFKIISVDYCESFDNPAFHLNAYVPQHSNHFPFVEFPNSNLSPVFRPPIV
jgi:hypothetical protein